MKKDGTILLIDSDETHGTQVCNGMQAAGFKNNFVCLADAHEAGDYISKNIHDIFIVMQSMATSAITIENTRNMVYMHEKFDTEKVPYMFLLLTNNKLPETGSHTLVHCYYKPDTTQSLANSLGNVISFWKDHVFPPKVAPHN